MARPANPENRYSLTCKVTGEKTKTNPKQFVHLMNRYGICATELDDSYVSRKGRKVIEAEKLTALEASVKYNIHINVANSLKCTVKQPKQTEPENEMPQVASNTETPETVSEPENPSDQTPQAV